MKTLIILIVTLFIHAFYIAHTIVIDSDGLSPQEQRELNQALEETNEIKQHLLRAEEKQ